MKSATGETSGTKCASVSLSMLLDKGQRECSRDPSFKAQSFIRMRRIRVLRPVFILGI